MIGGTDFVIPTAAGATGLEACLRVVERHWPDAVAEDAERATPLVRLRDLTGDAQAELFVYPDAATARKWDELGAVPELIGTMIHFTLSDTSITVTVDDVPPTEIRMMLDEMSRALTSRGSPGNGIVHAPGAAKPAG